MLSRICNFLWALLLLLLSVPALGQSSTLTKVPIGTRNNGQSNNPDGYVEYLPDGYNSRNDWPVLIWHHGLGKGGSGSSSDLNKLTANQIMDWLKTNDVPFIVLAPQDNNGYFGNGRMRLFHDWAKRNYSSKTNPDAYHVSVLSASGAGLTTFLENNSISAQEVATVTVNGALTGSANATVYNNVSNNNTKVWFHHGENDNTVGFGAPLNFFKGLLNVNGGPDFDKYRFTLYDNLGHSAWNEVYDDSGQTRAKVTGNISGGNYGTYFNWTSGSWYDWMLSNAKDGAQPPPNANAGSDQSLNLPTNTTTLNGTGSSSGGTIVSYSWTKVSGPASFTIGSNSSASTSLTNLVEGVYTFRLAVTDDLGQTDFDDVVITVINANQAPEVNAGADLQITLPVSSVNITSMSSDSDGTITSRSWTQRQGPSTATLAGQNSSSLSASDLIEGVYRFRITVTDDDGASSFDQIDVTVNAPAINQPPVASAGADTNINLPTNSIVLNGIGSDPDGSIVGYLWEKVGGPAATLTNTTIANLTASNLVAGTYTFRLTVTDNDGATDFDDVQVIVVQANQNPTVSAGTDQSISLPTDQVVIPGSANDVDGTITSFLWSQASGPSMATISNGNTATVTVSNLIEGTYVFTLTVTDDDGAESSDNVTVQVLPAPVNQSPIVNAGSDQTITLPVNTSNLNATASDIDGNIVSYNWSKVSGPTFSSGATNQADLSLSDLVVGQYIFRVIVIDDDGASSDDDVIINVLPEEVNQSPIVDAGTDVSLTLPNDVANLNATASDTDGSLVSTNWVQVSGPNSAAFNNTAILNPQLSGLIEGIYILQITVEDDDGATTSDQVQVTVFAQNQAPSVSAGPNIIIDLPTNMVEIIGVSSDVDGAIVFEGWSQISGAVPTVTINDNSLLLEDLLEGIYEFEFEARDDDGASAFDQVRITVNGANQTPTVNAGADQTVNLPTSSINLIGLASDADGTISSVLWSQQSGPPASLTNTSNLTVTINSLIEGSYVFRLTATDNEGASAFDDVTVVVAPQAINEPPTADAGVDVVIFLPTNTTILNGSASDTDGSVTNYEWVKVSGPTVALLNDNTPNVLLTDLVEGTYIFRLTVTDNDGAMDSDEVQVLVNPEEVNQAPVSNAGLDITIQLPVNTVTINGSGADTDGSIASYEWIQIAGDAVTLNNANIASLTVSNLVEGEFQFRLTVTDDDGASDTDDVSVIVLSESALLPPIADAGENIDVFLPENTVTLNGSGSDPDGAIELYSWSKISGPSAIITGSATPTPTITDLAEGTYLFELQVTDNDGLTDADQTTINVFPETVNQPPSVSAGADLTIVLPENTATIQGSASDTDGSITSFLWTQVSGGQVTADGNSTSQLVLADLVEGSYTFRLTVMDNDGSSASDQMTLTVLPENSNIAPTSDAGPDRNVKLPISELIITGQASDVDGTVSNMLWEKLQGPQVQLSNVDQEEVTLTNIEAGNYQLRFLVSDNDGASSNDLMNLVVLPASTNLSPIVNLGNDVFVDEGIASLVLRADVSDDGTNVSFQWKQLGGPNIVLSGEQTTELTLLDPTEGTYTFRFTAIDNEGADASDEVNVIVSPVITIPPPVVNLGADTILILPENSVTVVADVQSNNLIEGYVWEQLDGDTIEELPSESPILELTDLEKGSYRFSLTVTDVDGKDGSDDIVIEVKDDIAINDFPKVFSPNADGINDLWVVDDLSRVENCELKIYDSFGRLIYESVNYENDWDGTSNGKPLPSGPYYYIFKCEGSDITGGVRILN